jgi:DNA (cytosine-5)-methyltransferase 1
MASFRKFMLDLRADAKKSPHLSFLEDLYTKELFDTVKAIKTPLRVGTDCSGIEAPIMALNLMKVPHKHVFSSDIDANCRETIRQNYHSHHIYDDITTRDHSSLGSLDLYVAGFPCQAFSGLNNKAGGFADPRGTIFFECLETIRHTKPKVFILENVKGLLTHDKGRTFKVIMENLRLLKDYNLYHKVLNTKDFNLPQNRPRVYIVGILKKFGDRFDFPETIERTVTVSDIMENVKHRDTLTDNMKLVVKNRLERKNVSSPCKDNYIINAGVSARGGFGSAMLELSPCLLANAHKFYSTKHGRFLTDREHLRLQGFSDDFESVGVAKKQAGNSMSVNVLVAIIKNVLLAIN